MKKNIILKLILYIAASSGSYINSKTAQEILNGLNLDQKIGQLFIANVSNALDINNPDKDNRRNRIIIGAKRFPERITPEYVKNLIKNYSIGGIHFTGFSNIKYTRSSILEFQKLSKIPLLISQDFEYGAAMRLLDAPKLPNHMTLGAVQDLKIIYEMGREIARQCKALGVNLNFAPVADINNNPENPIIGNRSFGEDPQNVAQRAIQSMQGMLDGNILCCAKHFPGHGDTSIDSHQELPVIKRNKEQLDKIELYPFKELIKAGVPCIMTGHLNIPAYGNKPGESATTSKAILTDLLSNKLNFEGLIITDGLDMKALTNFYEPGHIDLAAFMAGADILLLSEDIPEAHRLIKQAIINGQITEKELDRRVLRILQAKERIGLFKPKQYKNIKFPNYPSIKKHAYQAAITEINPNGTPSKIDKLSKKGSVGYIKVGESPNNIFKKLLKKELILKEYNIGEIIKTETVIIAIFGSNSSVKNNFGLKQETINYINGLNKNIILVMFTSPYCLRLFKNFSRAIIAYEDDPDTQEASALIVLDKKRAIGKLPVLKELQK